jgi:hypothetical protein
VAGHDVGVVATKGRRTVDRLDEHQQQDENMVDDVHHPGYSLYYSLARE